MLQEGGVNVDGTRAHACWEQSEKPPRSEVLPKMPQPWVSESRIFYVDAGKTAPSKAAKK
ncbi:MAG TPA: hypothetical protein VLB68_22670 [Pyrinomonadaceae bacterium]|nr:hypothetical protein [Pyrinomonadaceae bacterium]